ncbi:DUF397 domain-containing protein [Herbidospora sp. NEAU-GS84]|uniref:DUF397 domain-containing protein n=1 Tax=Herbidospora solisilvae TaxID=2696284 RepID=A0A7C9NMU1_9ACTN|nr:DUF397 domain-containing protein [Herbidospora solisilvae]NAS22436.1 DUF397 domain-containing protein [Herbidospora solisilvae]
MRIRRSYRTSSYSGGGEQCVEVEDLEDGSRRVRHSKHRKRRPLEFTEAEWNAFIKGVKDGEFD